MSRTPTPKTLTLPAPRSLTYAYLHLPPASSSLPTLLFLHGFPSSAHDWARQIAYFAPRGYGVLAPDLLGAGGTSRPVDVGKWRLNEMAADVVALLDAEGLGSVVGVGHDWGSVILSRLAVLHPARIRAYAWLGLPFMEPITQHFDLHAVMRLMKDYLGYEGYAYWEFFARADAAEVIERNTASFIQLLYPQDPDSWLTHLALPGKTAAWMDGDTQPGYADWLTADDIEAITKNIRENGGIRASLNWYRAQLADLDVADSKQIPKSAYTLTAPSFYAVPLRDCICTPKRGRATLAQYAGHEGAEITELELEAGHWPHLEKTEEVNEGLGAWLEGLGAEGL
ncbi:alpha/beta-hydrolase [Dentipellis sp. KUC8613]|nr:alpha/beta-hydrolase [Dentipellis sp. KUC8613]